MVHGLPVIAPNYMCLSQKEATNLESDGNGARLLGKKKGNLK